MSITERKDFLGEELEAFVPSDDDKFIEHPDGYIHPNLKQISHSSCDTLHSCARKFELYKLLPSPYKHFGSDANLDFGSIVGIGTQCYLETSDITKAYMEMFLKWKGILDSDSGEKQKKTFWHALYALDQFVHIRHGEFVNYELASFNGKPATELGFIIDFGDGWQYRGFLDALLIDKRLNELVVYEGKTLGGYNFHEAMYKNSGQGNVYKLVVDAIASQLGLETKSSVNVIYSVYRSFKYEWEILPFRKSNTQLALWMKSVLMDIETITRNSKNNYFPMNGANCFAFNKPCAQFETCEISNKYLLRGQEIVEKVDDPEKYQFRFSIEDIIAAQMEKQI